jgi:hypothetical protein
MREWRRSKARSKALQLLPTSSSGPLLWKLKEPSSEHAASEEKGPILSTNQPSVHQESQNSASPQGNAANDCITPPFSRGHALWGRPNSIHPPARSILGAGRVDPFASCPIPLGPAQIKLLDHSEPPLFIRSSLRNSLFPPITNTPVGNGLVLYLTPS